MPDDPLAFDTDRCPIDPVTRIPCGNLLHDPRISDAPPDTVDCPEIPLDEMPEGACRELLPDEDQPETQKLRYGQTPEENPPQLTYFFRKLPCCDYELQMELGIPCAQAQPQTTTPIPFVWTDDTTELTYQFTQDPNTCEFTLGMNFSLHCPVISPETTATTVTFASGSGALTYQFSRIGATCDYSLAIAVDYAGGEFACPDITPITETTEPITFGVGEITYHFVKVDCTYDLVIDALTVPCPLITPAYSYETTIEFEDAVLGTLNYGFIVGDNCDYELLIVATAPCPHFDPYAAPTYVYGYSAGGVDSYISYQFSRTVDCEYTLTLDWVMPCPVIGPETPTDATITTSGELPASITYSFTKDLTDCEYTLEIEANLPCMCVPVYDAYGYVVGLESLKAPAS